MDVISQNKYDKIIPLFLVLPAFLVNPTNQQSIQLQGSPKKVTPFRSVIKLY